MALPTFLLIGAPRAGTTAVHQWLGQHPDVCVSQPAQTQFFSLHTEHGLAFYEKFFAHYRGEAAVGESTSMYLALPHVPRRIAAVLPSARLIVVLRDPVRQAFTSWWMLHSLGVEQRDFADAVSEELSLPPLAEGDAEAYWGGLLAATQQGRPRAGVRYLLLGRYTEAIERYLTWFDRRQLTLLLHDDLLTSPERTAADIIDAVGVDPSRARSPMPSQVDLSGGRRGTAGPPAMDSALRRDLEAYFANANAGLEDLLGRAVPWESASA